MSRHTTRPHDSARDQRRAALRIHPGSHASDTHADDTGAAGNEASDSNANDAPASARLGDRRSLAMTTLLSAQQLHKSYRKGPVTVPVLRGVDFAVGAGEFLSIIGQSGSGKSTLLHLLATLDRPDKGQITFDGQRIDKLPSR